MRRTSLFATISALLLACSSGGSTTSSSSSAGTSSGGAGGTMGTGTGGQGGACVAGTSCDGGKGVCAGGVCCAPTSVCGSACCAATDVCNFEHCETPGATCVDASDCPPGSYCDYALGTPGSMGAGGSCQGGVVPATGKCLSLPPECAPGQDPGSPITCLPKCEYHPTSDFTPTVKFSWGGDTAPPYSSDVMMAPIVVNLDDDNCDMKVNQDDIPEIVFSTFTGGAYFKQGTLHAISIVNGQLVDKLTVPNVVQPGGGLAAADLDGDGRPEIVGCMNPGPSGAACCDALAQNTGAIAFKADGTTLWTSPDTSQVHCGYEAPVIGDLDGDGHPEVVIGWTVLDGATGAVKKNLDPTATYGAKITGLSDLDGDGHLDVTDGQRAYRADGTVIWDLRSGSDAIPVGYHAVGDFDLDGKPEVVVISSSGPHTMSLVTYDPMSASHAKVIRKGVDINNGNSTAAFCGVASEYGGGPPTVADFNGDGVPDVGAAGAVGYVVFDGAKMMNAAIPNASLALWFKTTHDCSSAVTGSSVFDFDGDGRAEVVYSDEYHLWMYDGQTGNNLIPSTCNTTGTLWEYPVVADVDNDGQADIVVASNAYGITCPDDGSKQSGIRILGSASAGWVRTRRIWNEHTYHITNVSESGQVPANELANWTQMGLNNYRLNRQPGSVFAAPDAVVSVGPRCDASGYALVATVRNLGTAPLPAGVAVGFYEGTPPSGSLLGVGATTKTLYPAEAENVVLPLASPPPAITTGMTPVYAVVDDGMPMHPWHECRTDNDVSMAVSGQCVVPQ
jgi:hypothetical protein